MKRFYCDLYVCVIEFDFTFEGFDINKLIYMRIYEYSKKKREN